MALILSGGGAKGVDDVLFSGAGGHCTIIFTQDQIAKFATVHPTLLTEGMTNIECHVIHGNAISNAVYAGLTGEIATIDTDIDLSTYNDTYVGIDITSTGVNILTGNLVITYK